MKTEDKGKVRVTLHNKSLDQSGRAIRRYWGDMEVVDALADMRVFIFSEDFDGALKKDAARCVFARACIRQCQSTRIMFWRSVAYVDLPDDLGVRRVNRFELPRNMRDLIEAFDRGDRTIPEGGFLLKAPSGSRRAEEKRVRDAASAKARRERQMILGRTEGDAGKGIGPGKGKFRDGAAVHDLTVRNGTGAVHFNCRDAAREGES